MPVGDDHRLREIVVRQLHVERQIKPNGTLPDVEAVAIDVRVAFEQRLEPFDFTFGRVDRRILRKVKIDDQLRPVGGREELLLDEPVAVQRGGKKSDCHGDHEPAGAHAEEEGDAKQPHNSARPAWPPPCDFIVFGRIVTPITGANSTATIHEANSATAMTANSE